MKTITYKGFMFQKTRITTSTLVHYFGRLGTTEKIENLWEISSLADLRVVKPVGQGPFLTSAADCRRWVNDDPY